LLKDLLSGLAFAEQQDDLGAVDKLARRVFTFLKWDFRGAR
jgi:hypothetical protein